MDCIKLIYCILIALGGIFSLTRQLQMLQQNSYFISRYNKWLKEAIKPKLIINVIFILAFCALAFFKQDIVLLILAVITTVFKIFNAKSKQKKSIKPLVYTARIKRMYAAACVLFAVLSILNTLVFEYLIYIIIVLAFAPFITAILVRTINAPIDNLITRYYINDAKKMLKANNNLKVIGITGSFGKTSTKYILAAFLEQKFNVLYTKSSFNTPLGIVKTVRENLRPETQIFIAEMGAKKTGDIKEICNIAKPTVGLITSVGPQHLDTFKTIENVTATKFELYDFVNKQNGKMFLNFDNTYIKEKANFLPCTPYGKSEEICYKNIKYTSSGLEFDIIIKSQTLHIKTKLLGMHNVQNITGAAALAYSLGIKADDIAFAASRLKPISHRLEMKPFINGSTLLDDAYNANPEGSLTAVEVLGKFEGMKKIIVTPGLIELGEEEYKHNYNLGAAAAKVCDTLIFVGEQRAKPLKAAAKEANFSGTVLTFATFKEALNYLRQTADDNTVILFENDLPDNYTK